MKSHISIFLVALALFSSVAYSIKGATIIWSNTSGGDWNVATNWTPNQVPGASDVAVITNSGNYTVTLDVDANLAGFVLGNLAVSTQTFLMDGQSLFLTGEAKVNSSGKFILNGGVLHGLPDEGGAVFNGVLSPSGGLLSGDWIFASNAVLNLSGTSAANALSALSTLTNYGTVNWFNTDLNGSATAQIVNYGLWDAQADNSFTGNGTVFNNYGTFRKSSGINGPFSSTQFDQNTHFNNFGTVDVESGMLFISDGSGNGIFNTAGGSGITFSPNNSTFTLTGNPTFTGNGVIEGSLFCFNAVIQGTLALYSGEWGSCNLSGSMTIATNGTLNLIAGGFTPVTFDNVLFTNYGTVNWFNTDLNGSATAQIVNYGLWDAQADNSFTGNGTVFNNYGTFRKSSGIFQNLFGTYFDRNTMLKNGGIVDVQMGQLVIQGSYALAGGILNFGINSLNDFGSIDLSGNATLAGGLNVNFNNGYSAVVSNVFNVVTYGVQNGIFTSLSLPNLSPGLIWQTNYDTTGFTLSVTAGPPFQLSLMPTQNGTNFSFIWNAVTGQSYQVQYTTDLAPINWINLGVPVTATNDTVTISDAIGSNKQRFYRVIFTIQ